MSTAPAGEDLGQETPDPRDHPFWPVHVYDQVMLLFALIGVLVTLAVLKPFHLHGQADPLQTPTGIKPEWYFLAMYQGLKYVPKTIGVLGTGVFFIAMFCWPFIDQAVYRRWGHRRLSTFVGWGVLFVVLLLTVLGALSESTVHLGPVSVHLDLKAFPHLVGPQPQEGH